MSECVIFLCGAKYIHRILIQTTYFIFTNTILTHSTRFRNSETTPCVLTPKGVRVKIRQCILILAALIEFKEIYQVKIEFYRIAQFKHNFEHLITHLYNIRIEVCA